MRAWEIWTGPVFGPHPVLLVSAQARIDRKQALVVLKGVTMRPGQPFKVDALQAPLDQEDGLATARSHSTVAWGGFGSQAQTR